MTYNHRLWRQQDRAAAREVLEELGATLDERLARAPTERERGYLRAIEAVELCPDRVERRVHVALQRRLRRGSDRGRHREM